jgi:shikimate 5-dehydrogenase
VNTINKDTKIYGSFSSNPGNNGCIFFNTKFQENGVNAIYKSFYSDDIRTSITAAKILNFSGFAVSMPFKVEILNHVDKIDSAAQEIGAANTIINKDGYLKAYNTDWVGVSKFFLDPPKSLIILGNGGFSKAVQYACKSLNIKYQVITRNDWDKVPNLEGNIFNATPIDVNVKGNLIDGRPFTKTGKIIATLQAEEQYKIYTK